MQKCGLFALSLRLWELGALETEALFKEHVRGLVAHMGQQFVDAVFVIGHEGMTGREHEHNEILIRNDRWLEKRCCILREMPRQGEPGLFTDEKAKEAMAFNTAALLSARAIRIHSRWFTTKQQKRDELLSKFERQLYGYKKIFDVVRRKNGTYEYSRPRYTGKIGGEQDDTSMALQLALAGRIKFMSESGRLNYRQWR